MTGRTVGAWRWVFNLATDPGETNNLIEGLPEIAGTLRRKLAAWEVEVASPRLRDFPG